MSGVEHMRSRAEVRAEHDKAQVGSTERITLAWVLGLL